MAVAARPPPLSRIAKPALRALGRAVAQRDAVDARAAPARRRAALRASRSMRAGVALDLDRHARGVVAHPAVERRVRARAGRRTAGSPRPARCRAPRGAGGRCRHGASGCHGGVARDPRQAARLGAGELALRARRRAGATRPRSASRAARAAATPRSSHASHAAKPSPVVADTRITSSPGRTRRA